MVDEHSSLDGVAPPPRARWPAAWGRLRAGLRRAAPFSAGVLAALLALLGYKALFPGPQPLTLAEVNDQVAAALASATAPPAYSAQVYEYIRPSLVLIQVQAPDETGELHGRLGTGVVIDTSGSILTAEHVVAGAQEIRLTFADGTETLGQILTADPANDIAVLAPQQLPEFLVPAVLGNPGALQVGDEAYVVGHPLGLYASMSAGVISGLNRAFKPVNNDTELAGLIQIDAAVNPGNSGGPLLNRAGQVVGIVIGLVNPTDEEFFIGIGFAVPIGVAAGVAGLPEY